MNAISDWEEVPLFDREEAEAAFWADNRPDLRLMERAVVVSGEMADSVTITLRMDPRMLTRIKRLARSRFLNYQSMMKQWLSERMEMENREHRMNSRSENGFTLLELLVVMAIIGIVASMVLGLGSLATRRKRDAVASSVVSRLTLMIENYQSHLGYFPPDNGFNATAVSQAAYEGFTATNQLLYELSGVLPTNGGYSTFYGKQFGQSNTIYLSDVTNLFGRGGLANSSPDEPHNFFIPGPKSTDISPLLNSGGDAIYGLSVPLPKPGNLGGYNFVHYDSSSPNRHNPNSFDLWVEYDVGSKGGTTNYIAVTNGNWPQ